MSRSPWRAEAERVILGALAEAAANGLNPTATLRLVDSRYPFGQRANHPYQVWLDVRSKLVLGGRQRVPSYPTAKSVPDGQTAMDL